ncbi:MAG TPA: hypothetical protein VKT81_04640 [Bryobacteraceae bacterium]|nr:hypothetical protein [Bryobacteraceae bacterium]
MRRFALAWAALISTLPLFAQDARAIVRKSVELDQLNWARRKDYTWVGRETERYLDSNGTVKSTKSQSWETLVLYGEPHRREIERDGKKLPPEEQRKQQEKLDKAIAKLEHETPEQRQHRVAERDRQREKDWAFLREIPDLFDLRIEGETTLDGRDVWVIQATPRPESHPSSGDAKALLKIRGKIWVDKAEYQWVRIEAETMGTISYGIFLARLDPGAKLVFEQERVNNEVWLPKHMHTSGSGRVALLKRISMEDDLTWSNYRKFQVDSKIISDKSY